MLTRQAALQSWLQGFGMNAYAEGCVPEDAALPYITWSAVFPAFGEGEGNITVNVWRRTTSEARANADADEIGAALGLGGVMLTCRGGALWLKRGQPFAQPAASGDPAVKRRYLNIAVESITNY